MPAFYAAKIATFLEHHEDLIIGRQTALTQSGFSELSADQLSAWRQQVNVLQALRSADAMQWHILLEYPIPRRGKRIDAVILARDVILVLEFKCGSRRYDKQSRIQVEDYCLDLRDFHKASRHRILVPMLVATEADRAVRPTGREVEWVAPVWMSNETLLASEIEAAVTYHHRPFSIPIDPDVWNRSAYLPTPTIIEAARVLYEGQGVQEISRSHAGAENLTKTSEAVLQQIAVSRYRNQKTICFITGVPGASKTLAGLNLVHNRELHEGSLGVFLSETAH